MRLGIIRIIYFKELTDLVRDRRTVISMIVMPLFLFPAIALMISLVNAIGSDGARPTSMVALKATEPDIADAVRKAGFRVIEESDPRSAVERKECSIGIEQLTAGRDEQLVIYADEANSASRRDAGLIRAALADLKNERIRRSLQSAGVSESVLSPFDVKQMNVASERRMAGAVWSGMLGYFLVMFIFTGGMNPVIDMTAGERERRSMEMLLTTPTSRSEIVFGKVLTAITSSLVAAVLGVVGLMCSYRLAAPSRMQELFGGMPLDATTLPLILLAMVPIAIFAASLMMALAMFAKSFKEAQSYLAPLMFLAILPALAGNVPALDGNVALWLIPIFNASQMIRSALEGDFSATGLTITVLSNLIYAAICVWIAKRRFEKESTLFRS